MRKLFIILIGAIFCISDSLAIDVPYGDAYPFSLRQTASLDRTLSSAQLAEDFFVFKKALLQLHPGLYRYNSPAQMEKSFDEFEAMLKEPLPEHEFFKLLAEFTSKIKCGHTFLNPLNQPKDVRARLFEGRTYLPFYFRLIDRKIIVTGNISSTPLSVGSEITKINKIPVAHIIRQLLMVTAADGVNTNDTRLRRIESGITRENVFQLFDIYFPLFFPLKDPAYEIEAVETETQRHLKFQVPAMTRVERFRETEKRYGKLPTYDDGWQTNITAGKTGYLRISHSLTWRLKKVDYRSFIADAFAEMRAKNVRYLIIDWRGNDGGDEAVGALVASYLAARPIDCYDRKTRFVRCTKIDDDLFSHLSFYDEKLKQDLQKGLSSSLVEPSDKFLFRVLGDPVCQPLQPQTNNFRGRAYIIADATNTSASFQFLRAVRDNKLATIVGQRSGGNLQGINGGSFALLNLPNSRFEIDIPLYFQAPPKPELDAGIIPDYFVRPRIDDIAAGKDTELNYVLRLIKAAQHSEKKSKTN